MNISFLNPTFLLALPLLSIPIIIHLLTKKKYKNYPFSETKFIQTALRKTTKKHKLREYLLLFLRCLTIFVLTVIFSRPVVHYGKIFGKSKEIGKCFVILLDNSYSLNYLEDGELRFNLVKEVSRNLINKLDEFDEIAPGSFSNHLEMRTKKFTQDKKISLETIEGITLSFSPSDLAPVLQDAYLFLKNATRKEKILILISDLAKNGWRNINREYFKKINFYDPTVKVILLDVSKEKGKNYALEEISLQESSPAKPVVIETQIANYGEEAKEIPLRLYIKEKGEEKKIAAGFLEIAKNEKKSKQFIYNFPEESETFVYGYVELDRDNLVFDDQRFFIHSRQGKVKIIALDDSAGFSPVEGELYYFRLSLNPYREKGLVQVDTFQSNDWIKKIDSTYSLAVLANRKDFSEEEIQTLKSYLENGGNLFIGLGEKIDQQFYNQNLDWLMPAELVKIKSEKVGISHFAIDHPGLKIFSQDTDPLRRDASEASFSTTIFSNYFVVDPKPGSQVLIELSDGNPLLLENQPYPGGGKIFLYTSTLNRKWTNFPAKPFYPVLFQELVRYLTGKEKNIFSFSSGEIIRLPFTEKPEEFKIQSLDYQSIDQELIWEEDEKFRGYEIKNISQPGVYRFSAQVRRKKNDGYLLINLDTASGESNLEQISSAEIKNLLPGSPVVYISAKDKYLEKFIQFLKGKEITQNLVIFAFFLLILESVVANRFIIKRKSEK